MIGRVNAGGGGGLQSTDAILRVIAPAGSTVTISKGGVSKSDLGHENAADHTLYDYYFIIHASQFDSVNPWTVTATLGTQSISNSIIIDTADEYDIVLSYTLWLVKDGITQDGAFIALGKKPNAESSYNALAPSIAQDTDYITLGLTASTGSGAGIVYLPNSYDLSKYSKVRVIGSARNNSSYYTFNCFDAWTALGTYQEDNRLIQTTLTQDTSSYVSINETIDISSLTASALLGFNFSKSPNYTSQLRLSDFYLEV